jgi:hypothetical protein
MTEHQLKLILNQHPKWSEAQKLAFYMANMDFDKMLERRKKAEALIDRLIAAGVFVEDGHGSIIETDAVPPDFVDPHPKRSN